MTEINEDAVRAEIRAWLEANWSPDYGLVEWRLKLAESGWGVPHWPSRWYGRDLPVGLVPVVEEEFKRIGAIGVAKVGIRTLAAATILAHGTDLQKEKFLLRILTGEDIWCQLFSEPGSGSDVAGAVTRAEFRGNQWVVNGQKVWTTSAHKAHWGLLLARTDWDQPKHRGLSYFILDMKQPGVTVQPYKWYPQRAGRVDLILERAQATGKINDPVLRQEIAKVLAMSKAAEWTARRARTAQEQGRPQGPEGYLGKLASSMIARAAARVHASLLGPDALLTGEDSPMSGLLAEILVSVPASSIAGGTDEIQRNIISERVLKMPRERTGDTEKPFKDVPRNTVA